MADKLQDLLQSTRKNISGWKPHNNRIRRRPRQKPPAQI